MPKQRDTRSAITSAVIGALLASLILFAFFYFIGRGRNDGAAPVPAVENSK